MPVPTENQPIAMLNSKTATTMIIANKSNNVNPSFFLQERGPVQNPLVSRDMAMVSTLLTDEINRGMHMGRITLTFLKGFLVSVSCPRDLCACII